MKSSGVLVGILVLLFALLFVPSTVSAETKTLTFQEGDGGAYSSTQAADIPYFAATGNGSGPTLTVSVDFVVVDFTPGRRIFVRFPAIFGDGDGQIPLGSAIESASLQLNRIDATTHVVTVYVVTSAWDENTITGANAPTFQTAVGSIPSGDPGIVTVLVTPAVQAWSSGTANWGVMISAIYSPTVFSESFDSDDSATIANRPLLSVTFTPPLAPVESSTWGKVKALYR